ncbi:transposase [Paracoccus liaowanqingii]
MSPPPILAGRLNQTSNSYATVVLIENFFGKLKEYRGIAMRCCKTDESFSAFIAIAATVIRLR